MPSGRLEIGKNAPENRNSGMISTRKITANGVGSDSPAL
jgi:hypothetical protein